MYIWKSLSREALTAFQYDKQMGKKDRTDIKGDMGSVLIVAPLTSPPLPPPELLESPTVRKLSSNSCSNGPNSIEKDS